MSDDEKKQPAGDYEVGFCKPPVATRFQKGRSGNPGGRAKKEKPEASAALPLEIYEKVAGEMTTVVLKNGRPVKMPMLEVAFRRMFAKAGNGDLRALAQIFGIEKQRGSFAPSERGDPNVVTGALVVGAPMSQEEWVERYGGQQPRIAHPIIDRLLDELKKDMED